MRTHDDLFHADFADFADLIFETRILGFKDFEDLNRFGMNKIGRIEGI